MKVDQVRAPVHYLDEVLQPRRLGIMLRENVAVARLYFKTYIQALSYVAARKQIDQGYTASNRWQCFLQAIHFIYHLELQQQNTEKRIDHLHAHFAHDPTLVAYLVHRIIGIPFSFTAHARDLYQVPEKVLMDRIQEASAVITCCRANLDYLNQIAPSHSSRFSLIYHGVNLDDFHASPNSDSNQKYPLILSVGRLVEKKGFQDLLQALLLVKQRGEHFQCDIYGEGPLCQSLQKWIEEHDMTDEVRLMGERTQQELISVFQHATLFVLTPIQTEDRDRDGIPNVLLEAMAVGLPVITTAVAGIPELVDHNENGLLYQPHDVEGISSGIIAFLGDTEKRQRFGAAASKKVKEQFDLALAAQQLKTLFI